jgi:hypothetical protein
VGNASATLEFQVTLGYFGISMTKFRKAVGQTRCIWKHHHF